MFSSNGFAFRSDRRCPCRHRSTIRRCPRRHLSTVGTPSFSHRVSAIPDNISNNTLVSRVTGGDNSRYTMTKWVVVACIDDVLGVAFPLSAQIGVVVALSHQAYGSSRPHFAPTLHLGFPTLANVVSTIIAVNLHR